jgi:archaemetzincin
MKRMRLADFLGASTLLYSLASAQALAYASPVSVIYVQPLGPPMVKADVALVRHSLEAFYGVTVRVAPRSELPRSAYYAPRRRYRAERLLAHLRRNKPADADRILGLTSADISTTKGKHRDWGVVGLATIDGAACVISSFRTGKRVRLAKAAVHEIGHTLGLEHCPSPGCLMRDARGKVASADSERDLCDRCRAHLAKAGLRIPDKAVSPWVASRKLR